MLNSRIVLRMFVPVILATLFAACNTAGTPVAFNTGLRAWIDQPPNGATLPLGSFPLKAHARDSLGGGVDRVDFLVNAIPLGSVSTDPTQPLVSAEFNWNASVPGEYQIQAQAFGRNGSALSETVVVCVGQNCGGTPTPITPSPGQQAACKGTPVVTFAASPPTIAVGGSSSLSWRVSNADVVQMTGVGDVPANGTSNVSPAVTTTYTLVALCGGKENMVVQSVTVTVTGGKGCSGKPTITAFTATPASLTVGASSTLQWNVTNADHVEIAGMGEVGMTGTRVVAPRTTTTYDLVAMCGGKENLAEQLLSVTVGAAAPPTATFTPTKPAQPPPVCSGTPNISSFSASPGTISAGQSSALSWAATNFDSLSIDHSIGTVSSPGSRAVSPSGTTIYTLTARCGNNAVTRQATVTVQTVPVGCQGAPNISSFGASPSTISPGDKSTLSWGAVTNADSVSIDQGIGGVAAPGSTTVSPGGTTIYTLTAHCGNNTLTRQTTVTVSAPVDKQGPAISGMAPSEKSVSYNGVTCGATSFTVSANITDPSGVKSALLTYRYLDSKGGAVSNPNGISMSPGGGNSYSATINVLSEANTWLGVGNGQVQFWIVAQDGLGNNSQNSPATILINYCYK